MRKYIFCILCVLVVFVTALAVTADTSIALTERAHIVPLPDGGTAYLDFYKSPLGGDGVIVGRIMEDSFRLRTTPFYRISIASILSDKKNSIWYASAGGFNYPSFLGDDWCGFTCSGLPKSAKAVCMQFSRDGDIEVGVLSIPKSK